MANSKQYMSFIQNILIVLLLLLMNLIKLTVGSKYQRKILSHRYDSDYVITPRNVNDT